MPVYVGPGVRDWPIGAPQDARWIASAPSTIGLAPPLAFDLLTSALALSPNALLEELATLVALSWEEVSHVDPERGARDFPWDGVPVNENDAEECFVAESLVAILRRAPDRIGIVARVWGSIDNATRSFLRRLVREAHAGTIDLAIDGPTSVLRAEPALSDVLTTAVWIDGPDPEAIPAHSRALQFAALSPAGLPLAVVQQLTGTVDAMVRPFPGPSGRAWIALASVEREQVLGGMSVPERREAHARVFDALPVDGIEYLRRPIHALGSGDPARIARHHVPFILAMATLSRDVQFRYVAIAAAVLRRSPGCESIVLHCDHGAARLAPRVAIRAGFRRASNHYLRALARLPDPQSRTTLWRQLGNVHAVQRRPEALALARRYFQEGFRELAGVDEAEEQLRLRVELLNGMALVDYHEGDSRSALSLELRAQRLAREHSEQFPYLARWAMILLSLNTAKLLERRFDDPVRGIMMLEERLLEAGPRERDPLAVELARLLFEEERYPEILQVLGPMVASTWRGLDEKEELTARMYVLLAALATGDSERASRLTPRIRELCARRDLREAETVLAQAASLFERRAEPAIA